MHTFMILIARDIRECDAMDEQLKDVIPDGACIRIDEYKFD